MIDRYLLRYFLAVIDQGNFSKAAATCNVSQPTLSVGIAKLEQSLGQPLFLRTNRRVELTEAGARLAPHARRIEAEFAQAEREVRQADVGEALRLGVVTSLPAGWIETFLHRHRAGGSAGRIEIVEARERDLTERLARGRIDVALGIVREADARFEAEPLFTEGYALALSARHPLAALDMIEAEQLAHEPMIVRRHCELLTDTSRHFTARGVRPFFPARTTSDDRALAYVRAGLGVTVMPDCFAAEGVTRPRLADFGFTRTIGLLYAPHAQTMRDAPALRTLRGVIADRAG
jgi:LysR family transcriptional regulator, hydrogen peroxide-inducible genes activator